MQQLISETRNKLSNCKFSSSREALHGSLETLPQQQHLKDECSGGGSVADLVDQLSTLQLTHEEHLQSCEETQEKLRERQDKLQLELQEVQEQKEKAERIAHEFEEQMREMATRLEGVRKSASDRQCEMQSLIEEVKREREGLERQMEAMQSACSIQAEELHQKTIALATTEAAKQNLQHSLENEQLEHRLLQARVAAMEMERDNRNVQLRGALEEAAAERKQMIDRYEKELKFLGNCNSEREVQLMDDYEWKLREIEKDYKNKMENEKKKFNEKIRTVTQDLEQTFDRERSQLHAEKITVTHQLADVEERLTNQTRLAEVELKQLRNLTQELQTGIKGSTSQVDQMRYTESCLREELRETHHNMQDAKMLITKLQCEICDLKERHERKRNETENRAKRILDDSKAEIEEFWKNNFTEECSRLQSALEKQYEDEKQQVLELLQEKKNKDMVQIQSEHETRETDLQNKLESAQHLIEDAERKLADNIAARAKAEELAASLSEEMTTKQQDLEEIIEQLTEELEESRAAQEKMQQELELLQALRLQVADHQSQEESLKEQLELKKQQELEKLTHDLEEKKQKALQEQSQKHNQHLSSLRKEVEKALQLAKHKDMERQQYISELAEQLRLSELRLHDLQDECENAENEVGRLSSELENCTNELQRSHCEASEQVRYWLSQVLMLPFLCLFTSAALSLSLAFVFLSFVFFALLPYIPL